MDNNIQKYTEAVRQNPNDDAARNNLGNALYKNGQYDKALEQYQEAVKIKPEPVYFANIGDAYAGLDDLDKAIENYETSMRLNNKDDDHVSNSLGNAYALKKEYDKALENYEKAIKINPSHVYYTNIGDVYRLRGDKGDLDNAIDYYQQAIDISPEYGSAHNAIGVVYYMKREYDKAIEHYTKAVQSNPGSFIYNANIADAYSVKREWDEAIKYYMNALNINPDDILSNNGLGIAYYNTGKYEEAIRYYQKTIQLEPNNFLYYANLGDAYAKLTDWNIAIDYYRKAIEINKQDDLTYNSLGNAYFGKGLYSKAIEQYEMALSIREYPIYYSNIGDAYRRIKKWEVALEYYNKAAEKAPDDTRYKTNLFNIHNDIGVEHYQKGDYDNSILEYEKALQYGTDEKNGASTVYHNLYLAYISKNDVRKAEEFLVKAVELRKDEETLRVFKAELDELRKKGH